MPAHASTAPLAATCDRDAAVLAGLGPEWQDAQGTLLDPLRRSVQHQLMLQMGQGFDVANDKDWSRIYPDLLPKLNSGDQKVLRAELMQNKQDKKLSAQEFYRHVRLLQTLRKVL